MGKRHSIIKVELFSTSVYRSAIPIRMLESLYKNIHEKTRIPVSQNNFKRTMSEDFHFLISNFTHNYSSSKNGVIHAL